MSIPRNLRTHPRLLSWDLNSMTWDLMSVSLRWLSKKKKKKGVSGPMETKRELPKARAGKESWEGA